MSDIPYKKDVPEWRTQAMGVWTDILNDWSVVFSDQDDGTTAHQSEITNLIEVNRGRDLSLSKIQESNGLILKQLQLLNERFEEAFRTGINEGDI